MISKAMAGKGPAVPHLANKPGGIGGEVWDLRNDIDEAFVRNETPGNGGTGVVAVDEWLAPLAADAGYLLGATVATLAIKTVTTLLHTGTLPHARNLQCVMTAAGTFAGAPVVKVHGTDIDGNALSEDFIVANATVTGTNAFKTITSVVLPSVDGVIISALSITLGSGLSLGLGSSVKPRIGTGVGVVPSTYFELYDGGIVGGSGAASTAVNQTVVATDVADFYGGHISIPNPIAAELITLAADQALVNSTPITKTAGAIAGTSPDFPRKIQVRVTDANSSITAGAIVLVGTGWDGSVITESIDISNGGTATYISTKVYATLTSATPGVLTGLGVGDNVSIGVGAALGLPIPIGATNVAVRKTCVDLANEAVAGVDATAFSVAPTTAADAAKDYLFYFTYKYTVVQVTHNHTQNAHSHGAGTAAGVVALPGMNALIPVYQPHGMYTPNVAPNAAHNYVLSYERDNS